MPTDFPVRRWLNVVVPVGAIGLLVVLILPALQQARETARRTQSKNNLKQWMLSIENYESTFKVLPLGGSVDPEGVGHHGWPTRLIPYLAQTTLFNEFDFNQPWDTPRNEYLCREPIWISLNPGIPSPVATAEGYSVLHYEGNPNLLHRNHCAKSDEMTDGKSETWVLGEASGNFHPWAYPFNWRPLGDRLNDKSSGFGRLDQQSTQIGMADGSVRTLSQSVDPALLRKLASAPPVADLSQTVTPAEPLAYRYSGNEREFSINQGGDYWPRALVNRLTGTRDVEIWVSGKGGSLDQSRPSRDLVGKLSLNQTPATTSLAGPIVLDDGMMKIIRQLGSAHTLQVDRIEPTPGVLEGLQSMKALRVLEVRTLEGESQIAIQRALPKLTVRRHARDFGFRAEK